MQAKGVMLLNRAIKIEDKSHNLTEILQDMNHSSASFCNVFLRSMNRYLVLLCSLFVLTGAVYADGYWTAVEAEDLSDNDTVLIVDLKTVCALPNDIGKTPQVHTVELDESQSLILSSIGDNLKWRVKKKTKGYEFIVFDNATNEKKLYCKDANDGVNVGVAPANASTLFSYLSDSDIGYVGLSATIASTQRFLCVYNKQDWRCYAHTSKNLKDTNLRFFKYLQKSLDDSSDVETYYQVTCRNGASDSVCEMRSGDFFILPDVSSSYNGYDFIGWSTDVVEQASDKPACLCSGEKVKISQDTVFYAVYGLIDTHSATEPLYSKVVEEPSDWTGKYLIVCEGNEVIFNGNLGGDALAAKGNSLRTVMTNNTILIDENNENAYFVISRKSDGVYSIQSCSGYYIGNTSFSTGTNYNKSDKFKNSISLDAADNIVIKSSTIPFIFNSSSYFQYNIGRGTAVQLYKYTENVRLYAEYTTKPSMEEGTGISKEELPRDEAIYDLKGRRIPYGTMGIYIVNGKKRLLR